MYIRIGLVDPVETLTHDGMTGICCDEVGAVVFTNYKNLDISIKRIQKNPESEYKQWGGKEGFMNYLLEIIMKEDKFFNKNRRLINRFKNRYQSFCDDIVSYEVMKHVVTGVPMSAMIKSCGEKVWGDLKKQRQ